METPKAGTWGSGALTAPQLTICVYLLTQIDPWWNVRIKMEKDREQEREKERDTEIGKRTKHGTGMASGFRVLSLMVADD